MSKGWHNINIYKDASELPKISMRIKRQPELDSNNDQLTMISRKRRSIGNSKFAINNKEVPMYNFYSF